tara:strand:+ start:239 stop:2821 length:2583 start_codon:yes stop_codon:yes gene_type:complete
MRKIAFITTLSLLSIFIGIIIFLTTVGIKTDKFNNLINEKINEVNKKIKLNLNDVNLKLNTSNFKLEVITLDPKVEINDKKIDLEIIKFDFNVFDYIKNKNPISQILITSKVNNIKQLNEFINEYDYNLVRSLILRQIKRGNIKITSKISFDEKNPKKLKYLINGSVSNAEIKYSNRLKFNKIRFDFLIDQNVININNLELSFDKVFVHSNNLVINKINNQYEITGNLRTKKSKVNPNKYKKFLNFDLDLLNNQPINLSSNNNFSFKINNKLKIKDLDIKTKLNFDEIHLNPKYQNLIHLKNGKILISYIRKELKVNLDSKFLFNNKKYNNNVSKNLIKATYIKKQNSKAVVGINISNINNKINSKEFENLILINNFSLPNQDLTFSSKNKISFTLDQNNKIKNLNVISKINTDNVLINYKSQRVKKYFSNFKNQIKLTQSNFDIDYSKNKFMIGLKSKYSINNINDKLILNVEKKDNNYSFDVNLDLDSAEITVAELDYKKNINIKSNLYINGLYKKNNEIIIENLRYKEKEKQILIQNLEIEKNDKIKNLDLIKINLVNKFGKLNEIEFKKVNGNYSLTGSEFDGAKNIKNLLNNSSKSIFSYFKNLNTFIYLDIGKYFINDDSYLSNVRGEIQIKNSKVFNSNIDAKINKKRKFKLTIFTNNNKQKITNLEIERPEPFIKYFKFVKGFKEGRLLYESSEFEGKTSSNLKIFDFKVQEVPVLAKLLTLASLQGIADLLTGEGIRFSDFEMNYQILGNTTKIEEIYAIGPAISLMMDGYIIKDNLTSLKGTLVPATTINKTISKIPMLGEILVGKKIGEGVFGVSFKIKGPPKKLKTTVNPVKTLTPRFITRTLEKISN